MDKPEAVAWFVDDPIDPADPLAHVKQRARDIVAEAEERERAARKAKVAARAAMIDPAAGLFTDDAFTPDEVRDMWRRSGLSDDDLDSAANAACGCCGRSSSGASRYADRVRSPGRATAAGPGTTSRRQLPVSAYPRGLWHVRQWPVPWKPAGTHA